MRQTFFLVGFLVFLLAYADVRAQGDFPSPRTANYSMDIELDPETKIIRGSYTLTFNNPSGDTIRDLQFHLYQNAFRNNKSTFFSRSNDIPEFLRNPKREACEWAYVDIKKIEDQSGNNLTDQFLYIQPDDDNEEDQTVMQVILKEPVLPNSKQSFKLEWEHRVPKTMVRTGHNKDYFFLAQWFPKLGVYEAAGTRYATTGQWNCHQYHSDGEYYADFGVYEVNITVPEQFVVGASGVLQQQEKEAGKQTWSFLAEDVIDFTWTCSPHFQELNTSWKDIPIRILYYPSHSKVVHRYVDILKFTMDYFEEHFEKWPYPHLTVVDPPLHGIFSVGMEYPTLVTGGTFSFLPEGVRTPETLIVHEFAHQYFMQLVASNETEEAWLDEGFVTYHESKILDSFYGENIGTVDWQGIKIGNKAFNRGEFLSSKNGYLAPVATKSWKFNHGGYGTIAYNKTAMWLHTLEGILGTETMGEIMKTYYERWKYKHPCGHDFVDIANEVVQNRHASEFGDNLDWFFDQMLFGTEECDYAIASINNTKSPGPMGYFDGDCITESSESDNFQSSLIVHRLGGVQLPVEIEIGFDNDQTKRVQWDGKTRSFEFSHSSPNRILWANIDPGRKIDVDKNFINNSKVLEADKKGIKTTRRTFIRWIQQTMLNLSAIF